MGMGLVNGTGQKSGGGGAAWEGEGRKCQGGGPLDADNMKLIHTQYSAQFYITKRKVKKCQKKCAF